MGGCHFLPPPAATCRGCASIVPRKEGSLPPKGGCCAAPALASPEIGSTAAPTPASTPCRSSSGPGTRKSPEAGGHPGLGVVGA
jgi:hypothetical protein